MSDSILDKRLILVGGKGGVGRSTMAASIAVACARRGRRTLLFEANANDRYGSFFDRAPVGTAVVQLRDRLYAVNTNPAAALEEYGLMILKFKRVYNMVFENRVTKHFLRAIPGLDDYAVLGKCWYHTTEEKRGKPVWDTVVFDMPASGHSVAMLKIPWVILQTVPEGPLTRDARTLVELLLDRRRTALALVTLAEEMPANEARELSGTLNKQLGLKVARVLVNQVYPDRFPADTPQLAVLQALSRAVAAGHAGAELEALHDHADLARHRSALNQRYIDLLSRSVPAPLSLFPLLFVPTLGPNEIDLLSRHVEAALSGADASTEHDSQTAGGPSGL
ncbi:MAG TPA: ArsA family ATPase [Kofleriaceae bacterium]|nr:ArsA family ATPase [Kofleriaceae bacterium]